VEVRFLEVNGGSGTGFVPTDEIGPARRLGREKRE
jgi:hypothetical protein